MSSLVIQRIGDVLGGDPSADANDRKAGSRVDRDLDRLVELGEAANRQLGDHRRQRLPSPLRQIAGASVHCGR